MHHTPGIAGGRRFLTVQNPPIASAPRRRRDHPGHRLRGGIVIVLRSGTDECDPCLHRADAAPEFLVAPAQPQGHDDLLAGAA